ncbi:MAG: dihydroorotate dehydrogenase electron transfer subunit [Selenomonadaceae bacterium]|nr:dihydroorotate dehydrogenase electron transfer subunit [Selenomonadaceae bacterium]
MKNFNVKILSNKPVADDVFRLTLDAPELAKTSRAGQFVQVKVSDEFTLRRPLGIASTAGGRVKIFYRVVGRGTEALTKKIVGDWLSVLGALGNGFANPSGKVLLVGGGMGLAPLLCAAENFSADVLIGGRTKAEVLFWQDEFAPHVEKIFITTDDGSYAKKGFAIDLLPEVLSAENYSAVYTCGPEIMMRGVAKLAMDNNLPCQVSFEKRMACGLGACLSCSIDTTDGRKKVCKDGPIFDAAKVFGGDDVG